MGSRLPSTTWARTLTGLVAAARVAYPPAFGPSRAATGGVGNLAGEWRMTSFEVGREGDRQIVPYSGRVILSPSGTISVQAMNPDTEAPDTRYTVNGYEAYYGTVEVDLSAGQFAATISSAAARGLIGQTLTRAFDVSDSTLVVTPTDPSEVWRVTYERVR